jgi:two-component system sensor histidine kinase KdpD
MYMSWRRVLAACALALATTAAVSACMVPFRPQLGTATSALILVVPVVVGVAAGGFAAGLVSVVVGFLAYDVLFIPPYGTLAVGTSRNWVALGVYAAVMLLVARVVSALSAARAVADRREGHVRRLLELSELLVGDDADVRLPDRIVSAVRDAFHMEAVALLLQGPDGLVPAATAGGSWSEEELASLVPRARVPVSAATVDGGVRTLALAATGAPVGLLGLRGPALGAEDRALLGAVANQVALSLERARLRDRARRAEIAEETERLQKALMGAVSHDLRTPLATIKLSASTLRRPDAMLEDVERQELLGTIDVEADRLARLVTNLLDMTRVQAGALSVDRQPVVLSDLVREALACLEPVLGVGQMSVSVPDDLPPVVADPVLIGQVVVNLVENSLRHCPAGTPLSVAAAPRDDHRVVVTVADEGPGVGAEWSAEVFEPFLHRGRGEGAGVGLSIAKAFVEAHGERIWLEEPRSAAGAAFSFSLPFLDGPVPEGTQRWA